MRWKINYGDRDWHRWFAWYPVELSFGESGRRVWLEYVERQKRNVQGWICKDYRSIKQRPEDINCPVCGYYCLGHGGIGCIDKAAIYEQHLRSKQRERS